MKARKICLVLKTKYIYIYIQLAKNNEICYDKEMKSWEEQMIGLDKVIYLIGSQNEAQNKRWH
jgi:hypothetical protein